jgi:hypothetical protein
LGHNGHVLGNAASNQRSPRKKFTDEVDSLDYHNLRGMIIKKHTSGYRRKGKLEFELKGHQIFQVSGGMGDTQQENSFASELLCMASKNPRDINKALGSLDSNDNSTRNESIRASQKQFLLNSQGNPEGLSAWDPKLNVSRIYERPFNGRDSADNMGSCDKNSKCDTIDKHSCYGQENFQIGNQQWVFNDFIRPFSGSKETSQKRGKKFDVRINSESNGSGLFNIQGLAYNISTPKGQGGQMKSRDTSQGDITLTTKDFGCLDHNKSNQSYIGKNSDQLNISAYKGFHGFYRFGNPYAKKSENTFCDDQSPSKTIHAFDGNNTGSLDDLKLQNVPVKNRQAMIKTQKLSPSDRKFVRTIQGGSKFRQRSSMGVNSENNRTFCGKFNSVGDMNIIG